MSALLTQPQFQFFDLTETFEPVNYCGIIGGIQCFPMMDMYDLAFQLILSFDNTPEADDFEASGVWNVKMVTTDGLVEIGLLSSAPTAYELFRIEGTDDFILQYRGPSDGIFTELEFGQCFHLLFNAYHGDDLEIPIFNYWVSQCFYLPDTDESCYTSVIKYRNDEDGFGFRYCYTPEGDDLFMNSIRLAFYLRRPQYSEEQRVFQRSDGTLKKVSSVIKKTYELITDRYTDRVHEPLKIALAHDTVQIINSDINIFVVVEEDYAIQWSDFKDREDAQATTRVSVAPYTAVNSSCGPCIVPCDMEAQNTWEPTFGGRIFNDPGGVYEVDLTGAVISMSGCTAVLYQIVEGTLDGNIVSVTVDPNTGIATMTMDDPIVEPPGTGGMAGLFEFTVSCADNTLCEPIQLFFYGTISNFLCMPAVNMVVSLITETTARIEATLNSPFAACGYTISVYPVGAPGSPVFTDTYDASVLPEGTATHDLQFDVTGLTSDVDYVFEIISDCCDGNEQEATEEFTTLAEPPGYTEIPDVCFGPDESDACGCGMAADNVFVAAPDTEITLGAFVYLNAALTITVPDGFISDPGSSIIYVISGGEVVSDTGNSC